MSRGVLYLVLIALPFHAIAQFVDVTLEMGTPTITDDPWYGHGVCLVDINRDGWDDVTCCTFSSGVFVYENNPTGWVRRNIVPYLGNAKSAVYGDYDRDGDLDLFVSYRLGSMRLFRNDGNWVFTDVTVIAGLSGFPIVASWGACWEDYNRDGWLDLFVVNYDSAPNSFNRCLKNNGDGTFTDVAASLGVQGGGTFPFMPTFFRANQDSFNDLMICVDFLPSDRLFLGNELESFSDLSATCGLNFNVNNMTSSPGDFDKDGDFDLYITNTPGVGSFLYLNNGSAFFSNAPTYVGANINAWTWGAAWLDFNNDRNLDVVTASQSTNGLSSLYLLRNNGGAFQDITPDLFKFIPNSNYAVCKGDVNRDGFPDIYLNVEDGGYNRLYRNTQSGNNYIKIELEGVQSNLDGIGTFIQAYVEGTEIIHQLRGGEQYLSQNSQHLIIPAKSANQIDSLVVMWPSGQEDRYFNIPVNKHYHFVEGNTSPISLIASNSVLCPGENVAITSENGGVVHWSTGQIESSIQVSSTSSVFGLKADERNIYWFTDTLQIESAQLDSVIYEVTPPSCNSDSLGQICLLTDSVYFQIEQQSCLSQIASGVHSWSIINHGCEAVLTAEIPEVILPDVLFQIEQPSCLNNELGQVEIIDTIWNVINQANAQNLSEGMHLIQVQNGWCVSEIEVEVLNTEVLQVGYELVHPTCFNSPNTGEIHLTSDSLIWHQLILQGDTIFSGTTSHIDSLLGGEYTLNSANELGCVVEQQIHLNVPPVWSIEVITSDVLCFGENSGTANFSVIGNNSTIQFEIESGSGFDLNTNLPLVENLSAGQYYLYATDSLSCAVNTEFIIEEPLPLALEIDTSSWLGQFPVTLMAQISGGAEPYEFSWSNGCAIASCDVFTEGNIELSVFDSNGCFVSAQWQTPSQISENNELQYWLSNNTLHFSEYGQIQIFSYTGQIIHEMYSNRADCEYDGCFVVRMIARNGRVISIPNCHLK
jgi:hypothetical protein